MSTFACASIAKPFAACSRKPRYPISPSFHSPLSAATTPIWNEMNGSSWSSNKRAYLEDVSVWYPNMIALRIQTASPATKGEPSPPVNNPTPTIAATDAGQVNHGTRWPASPANTGTLSTVNVLVSAPFAEVVPSRPMICRK